MDDFYSTKQRKDWNEPIRRIIQAIDKHTSLYLELRDPWHRDKAEDLRHYLQELKDYITKEEELSREK